MHRSCPVNCFPVAVMAVCAVLTPAVARAANSAYTCTVFTYGDPDWVIKPTGINNSGAVVGYATDTNQVSHGFLRRPDGSTVAIDAPAVAGLGSTQPQAINNAGQIAGMYSIGGETHGFIRNTDGSYVDVAPPAPPDDAGPGSSIYAFVVSGINDQGVIAGAYHVDSTLHIDPNWYIYTRDPDGTYHFADRFRSMFGRFNVSAVLNNAGYVLERGGDSDAVLDPPGSALPFPGLPSLQNTPLYNATSGLNNNLATAGTLLNIGSGFLRTAAGNITGIFCPRDISANLTIAAVNDGSVVTGTFERNSKVKA